MHAIPDATLRFLAVGDFGEQGAPATFAAEGMALYVRSQCSFSIFSEREKAKKVFEDIDSF